MGQQCEQCKWNCQQKNKQFCTDFRSVAHKATEKKKPAAATATVETIKQQKENKRNAQMTVLCIFCAFISFSLFHFHSSPGVFVTLFFLFRSNPFCSWKHSQLHFCYCNNSRTKEKLQNSNEEWQTCKWFIFAHVCIFFGFRSSASDKQKNGKSKWWCILSNENAIFCMAATHIALACAQWWWSTLIDNFGWNSFEFLLFKMIRHFGKTIWKRFIDF